MTNIYLLFRCFFNAISKFQKQIYLSTADIKNQLKNQLKGVYINKKLKLSRVLQ